MAGQPNKSGPYAEAVKRCAKVGAANADDAAVMASYCETTLQLMVGAASPQLVWEGAQKSGMTALELARLCLESPAAVHDLMWL